MNFLFDRINAVREVKIPLLGKVSVAQLWDFAEIRVSEHAYKRFAQRVMRREVADDQSRARCVELLRLALIVQSTDERNLCVAQLERRGVLIEFVISNGGRVTTVLTHTQRDAIRSEVQDNHAARAKRLSKRLAVAPATPKWFVRGRPRAVQRHGA